MSTTEHPSVISPPVGSKRALCDRVRERSREIRALGVSRLALFGSLSTGSPTPSSDVDLLVEFAPGAKSFDRFMALAFLLEELLGRSVDLLTPESLSPHFGPRILNEAEQIPLL